MHKMLRNARCARTAVCLALAAGCVAALLAAQPTATTVEQADKLFEQKHYKEAADAYGTLVEAQGEKWRHAAERRIMSQLRLNLFDDAVASALDYVKRCEGTPYEARAERLTGNLYMSLPHWGTRSGGTFYRAERRQGIRLQTWRYDKRHGVAHMERARQLYAAFDEPVKLAGLPENERAGWHNERIECIFDLASMVSQFGIYSDNGYYWHAWWGERDDFLAETAGEKDFEEGFSYREWTRKRPIGLRVTPDGDPIWPSEPAAYSPDLNDDQKILYLLAEARALDRTPERKYVALGYYRQAMLARKRFGMDRLNTCANYYYAGGRHPLQEELKSFNPWEMTDEQALILAGGRIRLVELPPQFDVFGLLRKVTTEYARTGVADQAGYAVGLYYQSRQQYKSSIAEYDALRAAFPRSNWSAQAAGQISAIKEPQVRLSDHGIQPPGRPAELQLTYRNMDKVWFVARSINLEALLKELRAETMKNDRNSQRHMSAMANWHRFFAYQARPSSISPEMAIAFRHLGPEVVRWTGAVENDGTHRYAQATLPAGIKERGAYVVYAYVGDPPPADAEKTGIDAVFLGASRAVVALTDLAIVEKTTDKGKLYYVCDAATGSPVPAAAVDVLEAWTTYDRPNRRQVYHSKLTNLKSDKDGTALYPYTSGGGHRGRVTALVKAQERLAWSGMRWWGGYSPSGMRDGWSAYIITDRPVYRPEQTVRLKAWVRHMVRGEYQTGVTGRFTVQVHDPRGNKVHDVTKQADEFGGLDTEFVLGDEPALGLYRIGIRTGSRSVGGQSFRVEEYKKPEFEVTVEPDKSHAKLGEKLTAVIKATYFFGGPVSRGNVRYRVFREEYTHTWYPWGEWDWLYGAGYGYAWYDYDWFPWWGRVRCCRMPPPWWGYRSYSPVRELVMQSVAAISEDGTVKVEIDTAPALRDHPDRDHRYVIEAEVTDASRRTITGEGAVKVTRQAFYATVTGDRGYCRPGEEFVVTVKCMTPEGQPVQTEGVVTISSIVFGGPDNARIEEKELERVAAATNERGEWQHRYRWEKSGQLKIQFTAPDSWGGQVDGYGLVWVCGRDFDGRFYRFNDLELVTDKRTYQPGEICHLMVNTQRKGGYVLFAQEVDRGALLNYRLLHLPTGNAIVDIPVRKGDQPNFFVEATTVSDARVHQESKRICVPPEQGIVKLTVQTDKPEYGPGDEATVNVTARTLEGAPADVQLTLSAFDKSVLYIQPEFTEPIARFFHGRLRHHYVSMATNLLERFSAMGYVRRPFQSLGKLPEGWHGTWGPTVEGWSYVTEEEFNRLGGADDLGFGAPGGALRRRGMAFAGDRMEVAEATAEAPMADAEEKEAAGPGAGPPMVEAAVRKAFADTALWLTSLTTGTDGEATCTFTMPENLTTWKVNAWGISKATRVGQDATEAVTTKNLLVRLQAPRFFMEHDEVVLSANVHNYLASVKTAEVSLQVPDGLLSLMDGQEATRNVNVPAGGERRVDWRVKVLKEGSADVTVKALTNEESDAMQMSFPVLVHGMLKQDSYCGSARPEEEKAVRTFELNVPEKRRPEMTRLEVQFAPSLVGAMMDALPYCLDYPYRSSDSEVNRFLPAVLTLKTLKNMGIELEDVKNIRGRLAEIERREKDRGITSWYAMHPIFDTDELYAIINRALNRVAKMQHGDGGWSWWEWGESSPYFTGYVLNALVAAEGCDVKVDEQMVQRGLNWLKNWNIQEMREAGWDPGPTYAFHAYVLSLKGVRVKDDRAGDLADRLYEGRDKLNLYGKAMLSMALANLKDEERARTVLRNIMQYLQENNETQIAWFRTPQQGWWYWWNNDIGTNAWCLRAIVRLEPKSPVAPRLVKWLLDNRRNGYYWRSPRETTQCVAAMSDFAVASGEADPDYTLTLSLDGGAVTKTVRINKDNFFEYDNRFVVEGVALRGGRHTVTLTKEGKGALYYSAYLRYFTKEEHITASGLQLKLDRTYFLLKQIPFEVEVEGSEGQKIKEKRLRYERIALKDGDMVKSGDVLQVELRVTSGNDYTYLIFEDMKPAGCEPTEVRSGGKGQEGFGSYMELRDEKVVFFVEGIGRGEHLMRHRLRAEVPGVFHALPGVVQGMYVPELRGNSDEAVVRIED
jgi:uncharacterized protein YfaS (alpha-2-macroglobulin family)